MRKTTWEGGKAQAVENNFLDRLMFYCDELGDNANSWKTLCNDDYLAAKTAWDGVAPAMPMSVAQTGTLAHLDWARSCSPATPCSSGGHTRTTPFEVASAIDRLIPVANYVHPKGGASARPSYDTWLAERATNQMWSYISCMSVGCGSEHLSPNPYWVGWPSYHVDQPASQARAMGWQLYAYDIAGEYHFEVLMRSQHAWGTCPSRTDGVYNVPANTDCLWSEGGNGDGTLFYPGLPARIGGTTEIPLETIRLKRIRDGREDYELLRMASQAGHGAAAKAIAQGIFPQMSQSTASAATLEAKRLELIALLEPAGQPGDPPVLTLTTPTSDNYKRCFDASSQWGTRRKESFLQLDNVQVGGVTYTPRGDMVPPNAYLEHVIPSLPVTGSNGSSAELFATPTSASNVTRVDHRVNSDGKFGPLLRIIDPGALKQSWIEITLSVREGATVLGSTIVRYRYENAVYNAQFQDGCWEYHGMKIEWNGPGGRWWLSDDVPTPLTWEVMVHEEFDHGGVPPARTLTASVTGAEAGRWRVSRRALTAAPAARPSSSTASP
jgi:hypothetical protein